MSLAEKTIDKSIPVPLYYQLKQHLRDHIRQCRIGDPIPTENELCHHFDVSRPTVRQAIVELVTEGYLTRSKGKGTFVTRPKVQRDFLLALKSFNQEMRDRGMVPTTRVLELCQTSADDSVAEQLGIAPGSDVIFLRRLRSADQLPLMVVNTFLPLQLVPDFTTHDLEVLALHTLLTDTYGYRLTRGVRSVEAIAAPVTEAELLEIGQGSPVQYVETLIFAEQNVPVEYSMARYRGDHSRFTIELRAPELDGI